MRPQKELRFSLFFSLIILLLLGCLYIYSASALKGLTLYHDPYFFLKKQFFFLCLGYLPWVAFSLSRSPG